MQDTQIKNTAHKNLVSLPTLKVVGLAIIMFAALIGILTMLYIAADVWSIHPIFSAVYSIFAVCIFSVSLAWSLVFLHIEEIEEMKEDEFEIWMLIVLITFMISLIPPAFGILFYAATAFG